MLTDIESHLLNSPRQLFYDHICSPSCPPALSAILLSTQTTTLTFFIHRLPLPLALLLLSFPPSFLPPLHSLSTGCDAVQAHYLRQCGSLLWKEARWGRSHSLVDLLPETVQVWSVLGWYCHVVNAYSQSVAMGCSSPHYWICGLHLPQCSNVYTALWCSTYGLHAKYRVHLACNVCTWCVMMLIHWSRPHQRFIYCREIVWSVDLNQLHEWCLISLMLGTLQSSLPAKAFPGGIRFPHHVHIHMHACSMIETHSFKITMLYA